MCIALGGFGATIVGIPVIGVLLGPRVLQRPRGVWRSVGTVDHFTVGQIVEVTFPDAALLPWTGLAGKTGAWLRRDRGSQFTAFSLYCQHLGCPVRWEAGAKLFLCPCHGGVYYADGSVAAGPPPRGLQKYPVRVWKGQVQIFTAPVPFAY